MVFNMRTIQQCVEEIRLLDKNTAVTENFIRNLCKEEKIKYHKSGSKYLVNYDYLLEYLAG